MHNYIHRSIFMQTQDHWTYGFLNPLPTTSCVTKRKNNNNIIKNGANTGSLQTLFGRLKICL